MRVLITGARGFVGQYAVDQIRSRLPHGGEVICADRTTGDGDARVQCRSIRLDVTDSDEVNRIIRTEQPTHVLHLAALAAVTEANRDVRKAWNVNFAGTQNIALAISESAPGCRLVYCSSAEVYGATFKGGTAVDETATLQPVNPYGAAKAAADIMLGQMALSGLRVLRLRPFNHTGPGQSTQFVIPAFAAQIARIERGEQDPVVRVGDLRSRRDFLDVRDVVDAYTNSIALFDELPNGAAINIASGSARAVQEALDILLELSRVRITVASDSALMRPNDTPVVLGNADRARDWLHWKPIRHWHDTLASVLGYYRELRS